MEIVKEFVHKFTDEDVFGKKEIIQIRKKYFLAESELIELLNNIEYKPEHIGLFLGEDVKGRFKPSLGFIDLISQHSDLKVFVNDKSEWMFVVGKDLFSEGVTSKTRKSVLENRGLVLVQNKLDENLGYGKLQPNENIIVKNILDRGDFLRREMR